MRFELWMIAKTAPEWQAAQADYAKRIQRYVPFGLNIIHEKYKSTAPDAVKQQEADKVLKQLNPGDRLILLDEKGKTYSSVQFAQRTEKLLLAGQQKVVFLIGGAYGFHDDVYRRADEKLALSPMTMSHQLARIVFLEQLYRAFTIIRNEPYHNN